MYEQLRWHQDRVREVMDRTRAILDDPDPDVMALGQTRWELARVLRAYQLYKHGSVFDPVIASGRADRIATAQDMKTRCIRMGETFRCHLLRWSAMSVRDAWDEYRPAALALLGALGEHLDRDRDGVRRLEATVAATRIAFPIPLPASPVPSRSRAPTTHF